MACFKQAKYTQSGKKMLHSFRVTKSETFSAFTGTEHKQRSVSWEFPRKTIYLDN